MSALSYPPGKRLLVWKSSGKLLSPGQRESQADASSQLTSTCDSVWPGLACTYVDLRSLWSRSNFFTVFHRLATQPNSTQVEWRPLTYYQPMKYKICLPCNFCILQCKGTCESVWPPSVIIYPISTCDRLLDWGFKLNIQVIKCMAGSRVVVIWVSRVMLRYLQRFSRAYWLIFIVNKRTDMNL